MDNCRLILNSNSLCVFCLSGVKVKTCKDDLFPVHHLTSKIDANLGNVFKDVTVPWAPLPVFDRMEILADACEECVELCEELLYKFQDGVERKNCVKDLLDKMEKAELKDGYKDCDFPVAIFYLGIVDRLRKEMMEKLHAKPGVGEKSNQSATGIVAGLQGIANLLNIPDLPMSQICSYLSFEDIRNCSTVSKDLRRLVFPSLINSSFISFEEQSQIPAMIEFIKAISNNIKKEVNLVVNSESLNESSASRSALLKLFRECGSHISHLKLSCASGTSIVGEEVVNGFRNNNSIPVRIGNELFPNMKKLDLVYLNPDVYDSADYEDEELDRERKYRHKQIKASFPFMKAVFGNSPILKELKLNCDYTEIAHLLFKLIGESGLHLDTFRTKKAIITDDGLGYLQSLNLKKVVLEGSFDFKKSRSFTNFLESQGKTIKYIKLKVRDETSNQSIPHFEFPLMELLEAYKLNTDKMVNKEKLGPIPYQTQLPKLKELELKHVNEDYFPTLFPPHAKSTTSVKELRLLVPKVEKDIILRSSRVFEGLSKLEIPVASYLSQLWKDLSSLEELTLHPGDIGKSRNEVMWIDEIFTGFPIYQLCAFDSSATEKDILRYEELYGRKKIKESLVMLTRLRLLRLRPDVVYSYGPRLMLSDIACTLVLMKMESLKCIDFCGIHPTSLGASRKVLDEMGKKMNLCFGGKEDRKY